LKAAKCRLRIYLEFPDVSIMCYFSSVKPSDCFKSSISLLESSPLSHFIILFVFHFSTLCIRQLQSDLPYYKSNIICFLFVFLKFCCRHSFQLLSVKYLVIQRFLGIFSVYRFIKDFAALQLEAIAFCSFILNSSSVNILDFD
jgi:hypothetical protein